MSFANAACFHPNERRAAHRLGARCWRKGICHRRWSAARGSDVDGPCRAAVSASAIPREPRRATAVHFPPEENLHPAADGRHADAIPAVRDAAHHAGEARAVPLVLRRVAVNRPEAQRAHREQWHSASGLWRCSVVREPFLSGHAAHRLEALCHFPAHARSLSGWRTLWSRSMGGASGEQFAHSSTDDGERLVRLPARRESRAGGLRVLRARSRESPPPASCDARARG